MASCNECFNIIDENYAYLKMFCNKKCYSDFQEKGGELRKCSKCNCVEAVTKIVQITRNRRAENKINWCQDCYDLFWFELDEKDRTEKLKIKKQNEINKKISLFKICSECNQEKLKTCFNKSNSKDGLKKWCQDCDKEKAELRSQKYVNKKHVEKIKFYKDLKKANENIALEKRRVNILNPYTASIK